MTGIGRALATVASLSVLEGCSAAATTATPTPSTTSIAARTPEELYVSTLREQVNLSDVSDETLLVAGRSVCAALDRGESPLDVLATAVETSPDTGPVILGGAVTMLCREHEPAVRELAGALSS